MNAFIIFTVLVVSVFAEEQNEKRAIVVLQGTPVTGNVTFIQNGPNVNVVGVIQGLKPGKHGFHIHEKGDLSSGCASTGGHFNPYKKHHGGPNDSDRHVGDLGNIIADENGVARFTIIDKIISLTGECSIIGRGVVVHSDPDDLGKGGHPDSLTTGHAGSRVACGIIGTLDLVTASAASTASVSILWFAPLLSTVYIFLNL